MNMFVFSNLYKICDFQNRAYMTIIIGAKYQNVITTTVTTI